MSHTRKSPSEKLMEGDIYRFEKAQSHLSAIRLAKECSNRTTRIRHLIKDPHTNEYHERIQIINRPRRNQEQA